jgi:hypothetical protein
MAKDEKFDEVKVYKFVFDKIFKDKINDNNDNDIYEPYYDEPNQFIIKSPIYYLFDGYLNVEIGSSYIKRNIINEYFNINHYFLIDNNNLIDFPNPSHATTLYKLEYNNRYYIIYTNSGLGINNHFVKDECVFSNIYLCKNIEHQQTISQFIINIYNIIRNYNNYKYDYDHRMNIFKFELENLERDHLYNGLDTTEYNRQK